MQRTEGNSAGERGFDALAPRVIRQITPRFPLHSTYAFLLPTAAAAATATKGVDDVRPVKLFAYNPSLVAIVADSMMARDLQGLETATTPKYIASFRLSTVSSCLRQRFKNRADWNMLGLALLDESLQVINQTAVAVDINRDESWRQSNSIRAFQDFRLYVVDGGLYLGDMASLLKVRLLSPQVNDQNKASFRKVGPFRNYQGDGMFLLRVGKAKPFQERFDNTRETQLFKNHNHFTPPGSKQHYIEIWPMGSHRVAQVNYTDMSTTKLTYGNALPPESNVAADASVFKARVKMYKDRGSACCAVLPREIYEPYLNAATSQTTTLLQDYSHILFGFTHTKTQQKHPVESVEGTGSFHYLTRLYAFSPAPPFELVARTGLFCFGQALLDDDDVDSNNHQQWINVTHHDRLLLEKKLYNCPRIQFVMSMAENVNDPSRVIVAYGINDCLPQFVEIAKDEIARQLFG